AGQRQADIAPMRLQGAGDRAGRPGAAGECPNGKNAANRRREEDLVGQDEAGQGDGLYRHLATGHDFGPCHARDTAAVHRRRRQASIEHREQVGRRGADQVAGQVAHQAFRTRRIGPFGSREHLLEPIEMLHASQQGLIAVPRIAQAHRDAVVIGGGIQRQRRGRYHQRLPRCDGQRIPSLTDATAQGDADDRIVETFAKPHNLGEQSPLVGSRQAQPRATVAQAIPMPIP
ncbi:hypothetical protein KCV01_g19198, partial [Aureobasidium melanogenum]